MTHRCWILAVFALFCSVSLGCGGSAPKLYPVTGTVSFNDKPVEGASILFSPQGGRPSMGTTDASGKYTITTLGKPGAPVGTYNVTVSKQGGASAPEAAPPVAQMPSAEPSPEEKQKLMEQQVKSQQDMIKRMQGTVEVTNELPIKYAIPGGSPLNATVTEDAAKNVFDFKLEP